jgi:type II secretory pathway predicted ATPase ExeA
MRTFNTTGPCDSEMHYLIPPLERSPTALSLMRGRNYLAVSGPRQSGKTSLLKALVDGINADGWARAVLVSCEAAGKRAGVETTEEAERLLLREWHAVLRRELPGVAWPAPDTFGDVSGGGFGFALAEWTVASDRPLVVVIDEVDTLARAPFVALLSQVRSAFERRGRTFPSSVVLAGMRSLRDHDIALGGDGSGSPFNIVEYVSVGNFTRDEVARLYAQHTAETGQRFSDEAREVVWEQTRGQPLLVNTLAKMAVTQLVTDVSKTIEASHIEEAVRLFEASNPMHLTSLASRLAEERVMRVVAPAIRGSEHQGVPADDIRYVRELGILETRGEGELVMANPIYARSLMRSLAEPIRANLGALSPTWRRPDGSIDLERLREAFLDFWAQHGRVLDPLVTKYEIVPHVVLTAWLDRVVNGGGRVEREVAVARGKLDVLVRHRDLRLPIEIKVQVEGRPDPVPKGLEQLDRYCEGLRVDTGWLVVFDQRTGAPDAVQGTSEVVTAGGRNVWVVRA